MLWRLSMKKVEKIKKDYIIGIDIGNTSVGWAVIYKNNFKLVKKGNKNLWGVRLFEEAETASKRRMHRSVRRRLQRRKTRIKYLQKEFYNDIFKVDNTFFTKLKESAYNKNDDINKSIKFTKEDYKLISDYYKKYPTIYHLRHDLANTKDYRDIRLIYLAIHHIIKYRGNFNTVGNFSVDKMNISFQIETCLSSIYDLLDIDSFNKDKIDSIDYTSLEKAILIQNKNDRKIEITNILSDYFSKDFISSFIKLTNGDVFSINKLFDLDIDTDLKISFTGSTYEDKIEEYYEYLNNEIEVLENFKALYDMIYLKRIFQNSNSLSLSSLMIDKYNKFKKDLNILKSAFRKDRDLYKQLFKSHDNYCLYDSYIHNKIDYNTFIKELNKLIICLNSRYKEKVLDIINDDEFLPRITNTENGKYPYQLNENELIKIIENHGRHYPFLLNKTTDNKYRLVKLLEFKIPYYIGPLNNTTSKKDTNNSFAWLTKYDDKVNITPYNFDEVININKTAEDFIYRMIRNCTYIQNEKVIPNNSILYSKFKVLNELKQIKVNNRKLTIDMVNKVYNELFLKENTNINDKKFKIYLRTTGAFDMYDELNITGYSSLDKFSNNMKSYVDFFGDNGIFNATNYDITSAEEIIKWITIFEDKKILKSKLEEKYTDLSTDKIQQILSLKYSGWSNLSSKLLTTKYYEGKSIMDLMIETNQNFMQIICDKKYKFQKMIDEFNKIDATKKINYELVENLQTSPSTKKGIYQSLKVINEIYKYMGYAPTDISIEMARGATAKKRTDDRKKYLERLYEKNRSSIDNYSFLWKQLKNIDKIDSNNEKLFLYFIQEGKSLYSKTPLDINSLSSYEVDHIIPRSLIKDDSIQNKALVLKEENQIKAAEVVLPKMYRTEKMKSWWEHLKKVNLISGKKYDNLCRDRYSDEAINGFINRQLVETRQICKNVANIIANYFPNTSVIYLNANLSSNYRDKNELFKFRNINNFHHAHDAYLTGVLGEYKNTYLKGNIDFNKLKSYNYNLYINKQYKKLKYGFVINSLDENINNNFTNGNFDINKFNNIVINTLYQNDILVTKKTEIRDGAFYEENLSKKNTKGVKCRDNMNSNMYGVYSGVNPSYATLVRYTAKNKTNTKLIGIPIYIDVKCKKDINIKNNYIRTLLNLKENDTFKIIKDKIPFYTKINWNNKICYLVGATDKVEVCNAYEFKIDKNNLIKWKYSLHKLLNNNSYQVDSAKYEQDLEEIIIYIIDKIFKKYPLYDNLVTQMKDMFKYNNIDKLSLEDKEIIITEMLKLLKCDSATANLKALDKTYSSAFGRKKGCTISNVKIINTSPTGLWEIQNEF